MIPHKVDVTLKRLKSCWRRSNRYAKEGAIDLAHPLAIAWSNCKDLFLSHLNYKKRDYKNDLIVLDWFANKVELFSKDNLLDGDETVAAILYEWEQYMFANLDLMRAS